MDNLTRGFAYNSNYSVTDNEADGFSELYNILSHEEATSRDKSDYYPNRFQSPFRAETGKEYSNPIHCISSFDTGRRSLFPVASITALTGFILLMVFLHVVFYQSSKASESSISSSSSTYINTVEARTTPSQIPLRSLNTISTEWGKGVANYRDKAVTDYFGHEYIGYYDLAAANDPFFSDRKGFVRIAANGYWRILSGIYFPRDWEAGDYKVRLCIFADDNLVYQGNWMERTSEPVPFQVNINNCQVIELLVECEYSSSSPYISPGLEIVNAALSN